MTTVWTGGLANWAEAGLRAVSSAESLLLQGSGLMAQAGGCLCPITLLPMSDTSA